MASWPSPWVVAPHYEFLPGLDRCSPPSAFPSQPDVLVTFDLDRPTRGLIKVPDTPLVSLRASMELPPAVP